MSKADWVLGRDTYDFALVRGLRTALWWVAWLQLALAGYLYYLSLQPVSQSDPKPPIAADLFYYLSQAIIPFIGWGLLTLLLAIYDSLSADEDWDDEVADSDVGDPNIEP